MCMGWGAHFVGVCTGACACCVLVHVRVRSWLHTLEVPASRTLQVSIWCVYTGLGWGGVQRAGLGWGAHFVGVCTGACACCVLVHVRVRSWLHTLEVPASRTLQVSIWCVYVYGLGCTLCRCVYWGVRVLCSCARACALVAAHTGGSGQPHSAGEHLVFVCVWVGVHTL